MAIPGATATLRATAETDDRWSITVMSILIRAATGGEKALLESRDHGFFTVDVPNFWDRAELSGMLRDVRQKPDKYDWLGDTAGRLNWRKLHDVSHS